MLEIHQQPRIYQFAVNGVEFRVHVLPWDNQGKDALDILIYELETAVLPELKKATNPQFKLPPVAPQKTQSDSPKSKKV